MPSSGFKVDKFSVLITSVTCVTLGLKEMKKSRKSKNLNPETSNPKGEEMESARKSAESAGKFLSAFSLLYGVLTLIGGFIIAMLEDEYGERSFLVAGIAVAFFGVFFAAIPYAIGQYIVFKSTADNSTQPNQVASTSPGTATSDGTW